MTSIFTATLLLLLVAVAVTDATYVLNNPIYKPTAPIYNTFTKHHRVNTIIKATPNVNPKSTRVHALNHHMNDGGDDGVEHLFKFMLPLKHSDPTRSSCDAVDKYLTYGSVSSMPTTFPFILDCVRLESSGDILSFLRQILSSDAEMLDRGSVLRFMERTIVAGQFLPVRAVLSHSKRLSLTPKHLRRLFMIAMEHSNHIVAVELREFGVQVDLDRDFCSLAATDHRVATRLVYFGVFSLPEAWNCYWQTVKMKKLENRNPIGLKISLESIGKKLLRKLSNSELTDKHAVLKDYVNYSSLLSPLDFTATRGDVDLLNALIVKNNNQTHKKSFEFCNWCVYTFGELSFSSVFPDQWVKAQVGKHLIDRHSITLAVQKSNCLALASQNRNNFILASLLESFQFSPTQLKLAIDASLRVHNKEALALLLSFSSNNIIQPEALTHFIDAILSSHPIKGLDRFLSLKPHFPIPQTAYPIISLMIQDESSQLKMFDLLMRFGDYPQEFECYASIMIQAYKGNMMAFSRLNQLCNQMTADEWERVAELAVDNGHYELVDRLLLTLSSSSLNMTRILQNRVLKGEFSHIQYLLQLPCVLAENKLAIAEMIDPNNPFWGNRDYSDEYSNQLRHHMFLQSLDSKLEDEDVNLPVGDSHLMAEKLNRIFEL